MVKRISESVQLVHIGPNTALTLVQIQYALQRASSNRMYARFYTDKYFIQVNFMKDYTINVSSNIRNPAFVNDLYRREKQGWTFSLATQFVYKWMNLSRRLIK